MPDRTQDLAFFRAGLDELESYLLSDELYWPLSGPANLPRLTIGGLLLCQRRLQGRASGETASLNAALDAVRSKWRSAWERKARREVHARLDLWTNYLADYRQSPEAQSESYSQQVQWRVILHLLAGEFSEIPQELNALTDLDKVLKSSWLPGVFAWETDLKNVFPPEEFWFLYGKLK